ncbi:hypothetical protein MP638_005148 [Amoeboaphelidium occidentale]|nr:hypothetical protein MP638_005148 [Amoeboaphelidium occidentale]
MNKLKPKEELDDDELRRLQAVFGTAAFYASAPIETGRSAQIIKFYESKMEKAWFCEISDARACCRAIILKDAFHEGETLYRNITFDKLKAPLVDISHYQFVLYKHPNEASCDLLIVVTKLKLVSWDTMRVLQNPVPVGVETEILSWAKRNLRAEYSQMSCEYTQFSAMDCLAAEFSIMDTVHEQDAQLHDFEITLETIKHSDEAKKQATNMPYQENIVETCVLEEPVIIPIQMTQDETQVLENDPAEERAKLLPQAHRLMKFLDIEDGTVTSSDSVENAQVSALPSHLLSDQQTQEEEPFEPCTQAGDVLPNSNIIISKSLNFGVSQITNHHDETDENNGSSVTNIVNASGNIKSPAPASSSKPQSILKKKENIQTVDATGQSFKSVHFTIRSSPKEGHPCGTFNESVAFTMPASLKPENQVEATAEPTKQEDIVLSSASLNATLRNDKVQKVYAKIIYVDHSNWLLD